MQPHVGCQVPPARSRHDGGSGGGGVDGVYRASPPPCGPPPGGGLPAVLPFFIFTPATWICCDTVSGGRLPFPGRYAAPTPGTGRRRC
uniref:Uncharacterized protein n=1 Tax=Oryza sativa subsp. japonica TaxID=39947 RepID=Q6K9L9_ORYSJ|nr:hypothetical protein [Oryza sativa Japonica Group]